jgi:tetratricopeptide (TPR) repeat protein
VSADEAAAAWPPKEAAPVEASPPPSSSETAPGAKADTEAQAEAKSGAKAEAKAEAKSEPVTPADSETRAALPGEEMPFSNSTLHWLEDGEVSGQTRPSGFITSPSFDPTAPVAGRRRAILVVGGAGLVAFLIAGGLYVQSQRRLAATVPAPAVVDPARDLTSRAEAAFAANQMGEALDLARLALVADPRFADAHFVVANVERARSQMVPARDEYRKYLELAPLGTHAAAARAALAALPP